MPSEFIRLLDNRLMRTVHQLHGDKKVHGDISPDNIVVTHYSGCSLLHPVSSPDLLPFTAFNTPFGEGLGPEHDVFAVGCVLYTVATNGLSPFSGDTVAELRASMSKGLPIIPDHIPRDVADLIVRYFSLGKHAV
jgi:serine/threonine protein kinase